MMTHAILLIKLVLNVLLDVLKNVKKLEIYYKEPAGSIKFENIF